MQKLVAILPFLALTILGCSSTTGDGTLNSCTSVPPVAGVAPAGSVCDYAWSCNNDTSHFEMTCSFENGNFLCTCFSEGVATTNFMVNVFTCDPDNPTAAIPAATSGCQWTIEQ